LIGVVASCHPVVHPTLAASPSGDTLLAGGLMAAGVALLTAVALLRYRKLRRRARGEAPPVEPGDRMDAARRRAEARGSLEAVMVETQELTRVCAAQMENRVTRLEQLLLRADERIAHLEALLRASGQTPPASEPAPSQRPTVETRSPAPFTPPVATPPPADAADPLARRVYELADAGRSPVDIAQSLDEHPGKVELILALRTQRLRAS
jgi:cell division protein FtsN